MGEGCRLVRSSRQADCGDLVRAGVVSGPVEPPEWNSAVGQRLRGLAGSCGAVAAGSDGRLARRLAMPSRGTTFSATLPRHSNASLAFSDSPSREPTRRSNRSSTALPLIPGAVEGETQRLFRVP